MTLEPEHMRSLRLDPREPKLPIWARTLLDDLRRDLRNQKVRADQVRLDTHPFDTNAVVEFHSDIPIGLPDGSTVTFMLKAPNSTWPESYIGVRADEDKLIVLGSRRFVIDPIVSNSLQIRLYEQ